MRFVCGVFRRHDSCRTVRSGFIIHNSVRIVDEMSEEDPTQ